jgi:hypothetical protein
LHTNGGEPRQPDDLFNLLTEHGYDADPEKLDQHLQEAGFAFMTNDIATIVDVAHSSGVICMIAHPEEFCA